MASEFIDEESLALPHERDARAYIYFAASSSLAA
jgi:hypothetical protein